MELCRLAGLWQQQDPCSRGGRGVGWAWRRVGVALGWPWATLHRGYQLERGNESAFCAAHGCLEGVWLWEHARFTEAQCVHLYNGPASGKRGEPSGNLHERPSSVSLSRQCFPMVVVIIPVVNRGIIRKSLGRRKDKKHLHLHEGWARVPSQTPPPAVPGAPSQGPRRRLWPG